MAHDPRNAAKARIDAIDARVSEIEETIATGETEIKLLMQEKEQAESFLRFAGSFLDGDPTDFSNIREMVKAIPQNDGRRGPKSPNPPKEITIMKAREILFANGEPMEVPALHDALANAGVRFVAKDTKAYLRSVLFAAKDQVTNIRGQGYFPAELVNEDGSVIKPDDAKAEEAAQVAETAPEPAETAPEPEATAEPEPAETAPEEAKAEEKPKRAPRKSRAKPKTEVKAEG